MEYAGGADAPADAVDAIGLIAGRAGIHAKYRIIADEPELAAMTFAISTCLQPPDLTDALKAQFDVTPGEEQPTVGACTVSIASEWLFNYAARASEEAKAKADEGSRPWAFTFILDTDTLDQSAPPTPACSHCRRLIPTEPLRCARCHGPMYCTEECRGRDWGSRHGTLCSLTALARVARDPDEAEEGAGSGAAPPTLPPSEAVPRVALSTVRNKLGLFQETALSLGDTLAAFSTLQTARFSSRVALFVDVQEFDGTALLAALAEEAEAGRAARDVTSTLGGGAGGRGDDDDYGGAGAPPEPPTVTSAVVRRVYVTAAPVYQLLLMKEAEGIAAAQSAAFAPGGVIRQRVGDAAITPGVRDGRAGRADPALALPRAFHAEALVRGELGAATTACVSGSVPHPRFPATPAGRIAAFQAGDTLLASFRDMDTGFVASAVMHPDVGSQHVEAAVRSCRRHDDGTFQALLHADVLIVEQLATAPGRPTQSVSITATWREEARE